MNELVESEGKLNVFIQAKNLKAKSRIVFAFKDNARAIMLYRRIDNDKGTNHGNRLTGTEYLRKLMFMCW